VRQKKKFKAENSGIWTKYQPIKRTNPHQPRNLSDTAQTSGLMEVPTFCNNLQTVRIRGFDMDYSAPEFNASARAIAAYHGYRVCPLMWLISVFFRFCRGAQADEN